MKKTYVLLIASLLALANTGFAGFTQAELDRLTRCCWYEANLSICTTPRICAHGGLECYVNLNNADGQKFGFNSLSCSAMELRGGSDPQALRLFTPPPPMQDADGQMVSVSDATALTLRGITAVLELHRLAADNAELQSRIDTNLPAAFAAAGIPLPEEIEVTMDIDTATGNKVFRLKGEKIGEVELREDDDGNLATVMPDE